ncbi:hypothetical protein TELCIR_18186 [Teladorsagia circumcincta]|uniref:Uncharacterized protein n=1 Tax=Teladorsagia circumcincta TaxID=45464 RepID=A0A2G9TS86_TELCI|nr:hypothetical protein TELCIR_18186 [Teladorsagia circumcincta]
MSIPPSTILYPKSLTKEVIQRCSSFTVFPLVDVPIGMPKDPRYTFTLFKCKVFALQMVNHIATYDYDSCTHLDTLDIKISGAFSTAHILHKVEIYRRNVDPLSRCDKKAGWQELGARNLLPWRLRVSTIIQGSHQLLAFSSRQVIVFESTNAFPDDVAQYGVCKEEIEVHLRNQRHNFT